MVWKTLKIDVKTIAVREREIELNSKYNKIKWKFIPKEQVGKKERVRDGKILRGDVRCRGILAKWT